MSQLGKLIVIDGTDGSGKGTQTEILIKRLQEEKYNIFTTDFPQYGKKSAGLVEEYLNGNYGTANEVGPYRASIFYAADRYDASFNMKQALTDNKIIISNRYVSANMGHQGGKIINSEERQSFFAWLYDLEYNIFKIPKPDLNIILHVDAAIAQELVDHKANREYTQGKKRDLHEADLDHLRNAEKAYLEMAKLPGFTLIECVRNGQIMSREEISELIWQEVKKII